MMQHKLQITAGRNGQAGKSDGLFCRRGRNGPRDVALCLLVLLEEICALLRVPKRIRNHRVVDQNDTPRRTNKKLRNKKSSP